MELGLALVIRHMSRNTGYTRYNNINLVDRLSPIYTFCYICGKFCRMSCWNRISFYPYKDLQELLL